MKLLDKSNSIFDRILNVLAFLAAATIIFTMLLVTAEVVMRYFLNLSLVWGVEITEYLLLYMTFLGTAWLLKREGHVKVEILASQLNPRAQTLLSIITSILGAMMFLVITWFGAEVTHDHWVRHVVYPETVTGVPKAVILAVIPAGSFLLFIQFLRRTYRYLESWRASPE